MKPLRLLTFTARVLFALMCFAAGLVLIVSGKTLNDFCVACILLWLFIHTKWEERP